MDEDWGDEQEQLNKWKGVLEYTFGVTTSGRHKRLARRLFARALERQDWAHWDSEIIERKFSHTPSRGDVVEQTVEKKGVEGLIRSPLLDALGHSTNIVIISLFLEKRTSFTRVEILEAVQAHKSAMEMENIDFSMSRVRDGKSTINFWIDHLVSTGVLRREGMAASFELNQENNFVQHCEEMYPREILSILEQHPSKTVVIE